MAAEGGYPLDPLDPRLKLCHPEPLFWAKDLPKVIEVAILFRGFSAKILVKKPGSSDEFDSSREVLRPK